MGNRAKGENMLTALPRSLEDIRNLKLRTVEEFARDIGISEQTYRRLLDRDPAVKNTTRRQIAQSLHIAPHLVLELIPPPTAAYLDQLSAAIEHANANGGWYEYDPDTGETTQLHGYKLPGGDA